MDQVVLEPTGVEAGARARWMVVIRNNDTNSQQEVIAVLIAATGCPVEEAATEVWEAEIYGKASVHYSSKEDCAAAAMIIQSIGVVTDVVPEWE